MDEHGNPGVRVDSSRDLGAEEGLVLWAAGNSGEQGYWDNPVPTLKAGPFSMSVRGPEACHSRERHRGDQASAVRGLR